MQQKTKLPTSASFLFLVVALVLTFAGPKPQSVMASVLTTTPALCGEPENVKYEISKNLDPSKVTFNLKGEKKQMYFFFDRYDGDHVEPFALFKFEANFHQDGKVEVIRGSKVDTCHTVFATPPPAK